MERNVKLYAWFQACASLHFWLPVFFLYFLSVLPLHQVLILEGIYYWGVVVLEVPSGYFSDRVGRRITLLIATAAWTASYMLFAFTGSFVSFACAELLLATGMAFKSGTDTSLLFDSLLVLGREDSIGHHEARGHFFGFVASAFAALTGGLLAGFDLRVAYLLSACGGLFAFIVSWLTEEPPRQADSPETAFVAQLSTCLKRLRDPVLMWITAFVVAMTVFNHVPYEFFQPYLDFLIQKTTIATLQGYALTPAAASFLVAATMFISAFGSRYAMRVRDRLGVPATLLATMALQGLIIFCMAWILHPLIVLLLLLRSMPRALMAPVINATVHPLIQSAIRATFLSLQSFAGRLVFGSTLFLAPLLMGTRKAISVSILSRILFCYGMALVIVFLLLLVRSRAITRRRGIVETTPRRL